MKKVVSYQPLLESEDYDIGIIGRTEGMQNVFKLIGQLAAKRIGLLRDQLAQHLLLLLIGELGRVTAGVRPRADQSFLAIALPDAPRRRRRAGHDLGHVIPFQPTLKEFDDASSHRQRKSFHAALLVKYRSGAYISRVNRARCDRASL